ncbi:hypothetical protein JR316_0008847 [Psilocybe cubensis]|uniref:Uncharacterized protein n=2 Tax=Psilocybe cubensis TaxID=181762 RepID=A0ACB8GS83_PSICU|nr:hypothetical protein JR316_0008847 [Psilocybe cubensis]KAH9478393.1 hypothetical protein JR316_0008847 [Psilocybe cubensis]
MPLLSRIVENEEAEYDGLLTQDEADWVELQPFLLEHGYQLRPRYHPNWKPSWRRPWNFFYKDMWDCPDQIGLNRWNLIDAVRLQDGKNVVIKRVVLEHDNIAILQLLNKPEMLSDPRNNTVPLLDVIYLQNLSGEQGKDNALIGVQFLHEHQIAHRDACILNFMMDPTNVLPKGFHHANASCQPDGKTPIEFNDRCLVGTVRYYLIDYETADIFPPGTLCIGRYGQEKDVPEMSDTVPYDPFKLDVYQVGCVIRTLIEEYEGLDFLAPVRDSLTCQSPETRPTATESLSILRATVSNVEPITLSKKIRMKFDDSGDSEEHIAPVTTAILPHAALFNFVKSCFGW